MTKNIFETHLTNKLWKQKYQGKIHNLKKKWKTKLIMHIMGHKDEPYYKTEKEMLYETEYTYESLSKDEKKIYNKKYE